ncbi:MAG TPA: class I SAM-dependent methyltransferase [archaeon]|nr:class I SAM-dependent methyltransferase [archaeon]
MKEDKEPKISAGGGQSPPPWRELKRARYESLDCGEKYDLRYASALNDLNTIVERSWILRNLSRGSVLDAGSGSGRFSASLEGENFKVVALDSSASMLACLREKAPWVTLVRSDLYSLPLAGSSFDAVVCMHVLFHLPDWDLVLGELARVVRTGGLIFFEMRSGEHVRLGEKCARALHISTSTSKPADPCAATVHATRARVSEAMEHAGLEPVKMLAYDIGHSYYLALLAPVLESLCSRISPLKSALASFELLTGRFIHPALTYRTLYLGKKR